MLRTAQGFPDCSDVQASCLLSPCSAVLYQLVQGGGQMVEAGGAALVGAVAGLHTSLHSSARPRRNVSAAAKHRRAVNKHSRTFTLPDEGPFSGPLFVESAYLRIHEDMKFEG